MKSKEIIQQKYKNVTCSNCNSEKVKKDGKRKTKHRGEIQRYKCKECRFRFVLDDGFYRMRNHEKKITLCMDLYYNGMSFRKIQEHLKAFYPKNCHYSTAYRWIVKYIRLISNLTDNLPIKSGNEIQVDEMEYHRRKEHKKKGVSKDWFIDSIDVHTRFMVNSKYFKSRGQVEIKEVLAKVKYKTEGYVTTVTTDGYTAYEKVVKKTWGYNNKKGRFNVYHNKVVASKGEGFNLFIERLHNSIRERTKTMRGFHGCIESASAVMKGYEIYYNFIRKHQGIGCCPYELAIPELELGKNRWLDLIKMSKV
jgi:transposase-like protein